MAHDSNDRARIIDEAALWVQKLSQDDSPQVRADFDRWIRQGAAHAEELLRAQEIWRDLDALDSSFTLLGPHQSPDVAQLHGLPPVAHSATKVLPRRRFTPGFRMSLAAGILAGGLIAFWGYWKAAAPEYTTDIGRQESIPLADGSVVHLNTHSRVRVEFSKSSREVTLIEGEALFVVAQDASRPFVVLTDNARIQALGTRFNVYRHTAQATRVSVLDGLVQVASKGKPSAASSLRLELGDEVDVTGLALVRNSAPDVARAVAWRSRRLMFDQTRLDAIAEEFNRYNRVRIRIEGEELRSRRMGGTFDADDPGTLIHYLAKDANVSIVTTDAQIVISSKE